MTKNDVKTLCEDDDKLQWWAMVLFAEIMEVASVGAPYADDDEAVANYVRSKAAEFPRLIVQRQLEKAKEKLGDGDDGGK